MRSIGPPAVIFLAMVAVAAGVPAAPARAVQNPTVTGPITGSCSPTCPSPPGPANGIHVPDPFDGAGNLQEFIDDGYTEEEYFFEGTATAFERDPAAPAWTTSGAWAARPSTTMPPAAYKSRMLVHRPSDPARFNGVVVVEWFNVTALIDLPPDLGYFRTEIRRDGFIWVGVSAQFIGINGSPSLPGFALKGWDPVRYGSLVHPGDSYSWDIFSQAAQAIRHPVGVNPLGSSAYVITGMIADGESQSAGRMTTYIDAIQPLAQLFDGFLVHSRGAGGTALFASQCVGGSEPGLTCVSNASCPGTCAGGTNDGAICTSTGGQCTGGGSCTNTGTCPAVSGGAVPSPSFIRPDVPPVLVFETETDTVGHFAARQSDGSNYRLWEPAGTAHVDDYDSRSFSMNQATTEPFYPAQTCVFPANMANERYVMNSAIFHLSRWINGGTPPPSAPSPISVVGGVIQRDQYNNALGGIRLPELDVPTRTLQGVGNTSNPPAPLSFCVLYGRTAPLGSQCVGGTETPGTVCIADAQCTKGGTCEAVSLTSVYDSHDDWVAAYTDATNAQVAAGFILPADAREAIATARASCEGWPDGTTCDDGDACTRNDVCVGGVCGGGLPHRTDVPLDGVDIRLSDPPRGGAQQNFVDLRDDGHAVTLPDPRITGATACIGRRGTDVVTILDLPASGWSATAGPRADYKFKSRSGSVVSARLLDAPSIRLNAHGDGAYALGGTPQGGVGVIVDVGGVRLCGFFGGTIVKDDGVKFMARRAPAPADCRVVGTTAP